jgi:hypothetical protein
MGTKEVLHRTRTMSWGSDTALYRTAEAMRTELPSLLAAGPRVIKRNRGNGGQGVWKVEAGKSTQPTDGPRTGCHRGRMGRAGAGRVSRTVRRIFRRRLRDRSAVPGAPDREAGTGGILAGMTKRPRFAAGPPMTLGNMRANGVRSLDVSCLQCHHRTILSADPCPDHVPAPMFDPRTVCTGASSALTPGRTGTNSYSARGAMAVSGLNALVRDKLLDRPGSRQDGAGCAVQAGASSVAANGYLSDTVTRAQNLATVHGAVPVPHGQRGWNRRPAQPTASRSMPRAAPGVPAIGTDVAPLHIASLAETLAERGHTTTRAVSDRACRRKSRQLIR